MQEHPAVQPSTLYSRWERQHWSAHAIDLEKDRHDWLTITDDERWRWYWLAGFSHFRQSELHGLVCLTVLLPVLPCVAQQHFLSTQISDEGRHAYFFERFHNEVLSTAAPTGELSISQTYQQLAIDMLMESCTVAAKMPSNAHLARAALHAFIIMEGSFALASFSVIRRLLSKLQRFPGLREGMAFVHRDEVRHAQFGLSVLRHIFTEEPSARDAAADYMKELLPLFCRLLEPRPGRSAVLESLGLDPLARRRKAFSLLQRHLIALDIPVDVISHAERLDPY
jgi:ribonucleoside-diphosphate reductase beta chain